MRQVVFDALAAGWSIEQIAELRKVSPRTVRREVDRTLAERRLDAPDRYAHLQVARLTKALRVADDALDRGELKAVGPMLKVVRALDRYHPPEAPARVLMAPPAPVAPALPAPPLQLTSAAPALAPEPAAEREFVTGLGGQAVDLSAALPDPQASDHADNGRWGAGPQPHAAAPGAPETDFVTALGAQAIDGSPGLPEPQASDHAGDGTADAGTQSHAAAPGASETDFVTGLRAQAVDLSARLPETQASGQGARDHADDGSAEGATQSEGDAHGAAGTDLVTGFGTQSVDSPSALQELRATETRGRDRADDETAYGGSRPISAVPGGETSRLWIPLIGSAS
ncbi:helix-turn-helix domain-containing protein [Roseiarcus fermentans]|uniref:helix-turn-helix domain-containing protein n=1 Tax=Roseiarcus fermentans TaxID=1473586 RepID=UPI00147407FC|nr:helix-turn-helix domain-containing protein [Roseiarcus fermentans]